MKQVIVYVMLLIFFGANSVLAKVEANTTLLMRANLEESFVTTVPTAGLVEIVLQMEAPASKSASVDSIRATLECSANVRLIQGHEQTELRQQKMTIYNSVVNAMKTYIQFHDEKTRCQIKYYSNIYQIIPEAQLYPAVHRLRLSQENNSQSPTNTIILKEPFDSLNARFRALFGRELTKAEYIEKNPEMKINFEVAPKLDLIILDTLQIANDFIGHLMMRGLHYHAEQGARIYFMVNKNMIYQRDGELIYNFKNKYPQAQVTIYERRPDEFSLRQAFDSTHQTNHVKVMLTYSESQPQYNSFIAGGRNLAELYFYPTRPENEKFPNIIQWGKDIGYGWVYFDDLDFEIKDNEHFKQLAQNLLNYNENQLTVNRHQRLSIDKNGSHIYAIPFDDSKNDLEEDYIHILESAQKSIFIISPYVNFTQKIKAALDQAKARGVQIQIYTNVSVEGDFMPIIMQPAATQTIRKIVNQYQIQVYTKKESILHIKSLLVDDQKLILGSVNFNQRSFKHDTEFSMLLTEKTVIDEFKNQIHKDVVPFMKPLLENQLPPKSMMECLIKPLLSVM